MRGSLPKRLAASLPRQALDKHRPADRFVAQHLLHPRPFEPSERPKGLTAKHFYSARGQHIATASAMYFYSAAHIYYLRVNIAHHDFRK